jgi:flagellar hook capping protein FlgD
MKKNFLMVILITSAVFLQAYDWSVFGLDSGEINNFYFSENSTYLEIICASDGFYTFETNGWTLHSYGLPVWDLYEDNTTTGDLIVLMGNGTFSDGIYSYTYDISEFAALYWFLYPNFLLKDEETGIYYAGGFDGLVSSEDGINWEQIPFFTGMNCHAMALYEGHYVVTANDYEIYYSENHGENWSAADTYLLITDMSFDHNGKLYGIFPDASWSSGLWSSEDFGVTWQVEFWDTMLNSVYTDWGNKVFVGWKNGAYNQGFAQWDVEQEELYFYNDGLPELNINKITTHPFIDCENIICCTDNGSYMLTDYQITPTQNELPATAGVLKVYPNPFNPSTVISFQISKEMDQLDLAIYNIKGQRVKRLDIGDWQKGMNQKIWDGTDQKGNRVSSGIYSVHLKTDEQLLKKKIVLIK